MIKNDPWILTLLIGGTINIFILMYAAFLGFLIEKRWDPLSTSEYQLTLERKSYLVSTLVMYAFGFEMFSSLLFILTLNDHLPHLLKGAMCATGSLNANSYGWIALIFKILEFILLFIWLEINHIDNKAPEYPATKSKYRFLLIISPAIAAAFIFELLYFFNIDLNIITTCCSTTLNYAAGTTGESAFANFLDENILKIFFYLSEAAVLAISSVIIFSKNRFSDIGKIISPIIGIIFLLITLLSITFHYNKYIYGLPSHHCPFDMLWAKYYFIGYLIYALLIVFLFSSLSLWISYWIRNKKNLRAYSFQLGRKCAVITIISSLALFTALFIIENFWRA